MRAHLVYLLYVLRHKWHVFRACPETGASLWLGLIHDLSKFSPSEWAAYAHTFYKPDGSGQYTPGPAFAAAWNHHQKRNPHHWQYWILWWDSKPPEALPMPEKYVREMVSDWCGAGRALHKPDTRAWYATNKDKMTLHPETRKLVEELLAGVVQVFERGDT